jgi:ornithine carbamoyltransferase
MPSGQQSLEVTNDVLESPAALAFDRADHRLYAITAIRAATLES